MPTLDLERMPDSRPQNRDDLRAGARPTGPITSRTETRSVHAQYRKRITASECSRSVPAARSPADRRVFAVSRLMLVPGRLGGDLRAAACAAGRVGRPWAAGAGGLRRAAAVDGTGGRVLGWEACLASWLRI
jgi:hypothetical protein